MVTDRWIEIPPSNQSADRERGISAYDHDMPIHPRVETGDDVEQIGQFVSQDHGYRQRRRAIDFDQSTSPEVLRRRTSRPDAWRHP